MPNSMMLWSYAGRQKGMLRRFERSFETKDLSSLVAQTRMPNCSLVAQTRMPNSKMLRN